AAFERSRRDERWLGVVTVEPMNERGLLTGNVPVGCGLDGDGDRVDGGTATLVDCVGNGGNHVGKGSVDADDDPLRRYGKCSAHGSVDHKRGRQREERLALPAGRPALGAVGNDDTATAPAFDSRHLR